VRGERETRELVVRENRKYSRRQLIWFRKEPNLHWISAAGELDGARQQALRVLAAAGVHEAERTVGDAR